MVKPIKTRNKKNMHKNNGGDTKKRVIMINISEKIPDSENIVYIDNINKVATNINPILFKDNTKRVTEEYNYSKEDNCKTKFLINHVKVTTVTPITNKPLTDAEFLNEVSISDLDNGYPLRINTKTAHAFRIEKITITNLKTKKSITGSFTLDSSDRKMSIGKETGVVTENFYNNKGKIVISYRSKEENTTVREISFQL